MPPLVEKVETEAKTAREVVLETETELFEVITFLIPETRSFRATYMTAARPKNEERYAFMKYNQEACYADAGHYCLESEIKAYERGADLPNVNKELLGIEHSMGVDGRYFPQMMIQEGMELLGRAINAASLKRHYETVNLWKEVNKKIRNELIGKVIISALQRLESS